jgi:hypothetical protein
MKQRITVDDLNQLTDDQKNCLREWWTPQLSDHFCNGNAETFYVGSLMRKPHTFITYGDDVPHDKEGLLPLLSIGQMIQFLNDDLNAKSKVQNWTLGDIVIDIDTYKADVLCDVLWQKVQYALSE